MDQIGANTYSIDRNGMPYPLNLAEAGFVSFKNLDIVPIAPRTTIKPKPQSISITGCRRLNTPLRCISFSYKPTQTLIQTWNMPKYQGPLCLRSLQREDGPSAEQFPQQPVT